jgi:hypothetical protein
MLLTFLLGYLLSQLPRHFQIPIGLTSVDDAHPKLPE